MDRLGINPKKLRKCLGKHCTSRPLTTGQAPVDIDPADMDLIRKLASALRLTE